jgi:hypothetical protein
VTDEEYFAICSDKEGYEYRNDEDRDETEQ